MREFSDLHDVNRQVRQLAGRGRQSAGASRPRQRPLERFQPEPLKPLPVIPYDYRDSTEALVNKDLRLALDGNRYCVHQRHVGRRCIIKADSSSATIYDRVATSGRVSRRAAI